MNDVEKLAKKAGIAKHGLGYTCWEGQLEKFAALIRAERDAELLAGVGEPIGDGFTQLIQVGDTPSTVEIIRIQGVGVPVYTADQVAAAVLRERERCAKVVEASPSYDWHKFACECAQAIRQGEQDAE